MKKRMVAAALAVSVGLIILIGTFVPALSFLKIELVQWAAILAGVAVLVGIGNLFSVHYQKIRRRKKGSVYSVVLLVSMLFTLFLLLVGKASGQYDDWKRITVETIIFPVESSLMALLSVTLIYASIRLLRRRADLMSVVFLGTAAFMLLASASLPFIGEIPILSDWIHPWLAFGLAGGGARGLLLGVALGALTTGLRALFAFDRPYGGK